MRGAWSLLGKGWAPGFSPIPGATSIYPVWCQATEGAKTSWNSPSDHRLSRLAFSLATKAKPGLSARASIESWQTLHDSQADVPATLYDLFGSYLIHKQGLNSLFESLQEVVGIQLAPVGSI